MGDQLNNGGELKRTPLHAVHVAAGAKMVPFGGWDMPLHYGSQIEEHHRVRRAVGLFDVSHMGEIEITGSDALTLVQEIITNDAARLADGGEIYTAMCREDGGLVDDLIVTRFAADRYFLVVNAATYEKDVAFMREVAARLALADAVLTPCAERWAMIAVQGPAWEGVCAGVLGPEPGAGLRPFQAREFKWRGHDCIFSMTGYTGEPGCELLCPPAAAEDLWNALVAAGAAPCGLAARDTLRLEKGYSLSGQDFTQEDNALEAGLGWVVRLSKPSFSGRDALAKVKADGPKKKMIGLLPEGKRMARHGAEIHRDGRRVGVITSGGYSPTLDRPVALGYVDSAAFDMNVEYEIPLGKAALKARLVRPPFGAAADQD